MGTVLQVNAKGLGPERIELEHKYGPLLTEAFDLRRLVSYVGNREEPILRLFRYKESFSAELVRRFTARFALGAEDSVLDPFCGLGTTLLTCRTLKLPSVGVDAMPLCVFLSRAVTSIWSLSVQDIRRAFEKLAKEAEARRPDADLTTLPDVPLLSRAFETRRLEELVSWRDAITSLPSRLRPLFQLLLLSAVDAVSLTAKDGQFLRLVPKETPAVREVMSKKLIDACDDIIGLQSYYGGGESARVAVHQGDARLLHEVPFEQRPSAVITSPPYLNRYDYSRSYALELCLNFVRDAEELKEVRHSLLRSHIESRVEKNEEPPHEAVEDALSRLRDKELNNPKIPDMILGYFRDMAQVISGLAKVLRPGSPVALVGGNVLFEGEGLPVDLILTDIAQRNGFKPQGILVTRYKGNSSQQMKKYGRREVRESVLIWMSPGQTDGKTS